MSDEELTEIRLLLEKGPRNAGMSEVMAFYKQVLKRAWEMLEELEANE